ncbi:MAG: EAL domain-containing protein [Candidatus Thiodiazotropha sp. (ex Myrtea sp. 'scaly one' KF741663)]|nr:EAL domain-containing protein [Candidatus Thiodiazotropha sp. (ex Myrtea sp. 'scaly one' KF741663)]
MTQGMTPADTFHPDQFSKSDYAQLLEVIEACDVGLCMLDQEMRILAWNRCLSELTGKASGEVMGQPIDCVLPQLGSPQFVTLIREVAQPVDDADSLISVTPGPNRTRQFFKDDDQFKRVSVRPLVMHPGCCLIQISDVDAETAIQEQARSSSIAEQRSLAMLSSVEDAVILLDAEGCIEFVNLAAEGMTGYQNREIAGKPLSDIYQVFDESGNARARLSYEEIVCVDNRILLMMHREGLTFPIEQSISHLKNEQGVDEGVVLVFKDVSQSRKLAAQLNWQSSHDPITRLYNRTEFDRRLSQLLEEAEVEGTKHCLLYLDIDRFKVVNDTCGHVAGDELLRQVGSVIKQAIRSSDLLARVGGDEFAILLSNCALDVAQRIADAIRLEFQRYRFAWQDKTFSQSVSIGLVSIDNASEGLQQVLSFADTACYAAKEAGRDQIHVYHPDKSVAAVRHGEAQWVTRIRSALEEDRFILYVQPIRGLNGKRKGLQHYEVLIRMIDESGGLIPPGAFIPAAERYDLMPAIDRWVVGHLIDRIIENGCCAGDQRRMFVNLSGQSLCDEQTLQTILDKIRQYDLPDGLLCFEVTETAAISNLSSAKHFMQTLKRFGCEFALDDFGSGLSSFGYLKHMPVEYLKIDGSFVKDMIDDRIDESMVDAINRIGHIMGLETIAECVENEEILGRLVGMGVDYAQGYGIRHPFPLDDMLKESA